MISNIVNIQLMQERNRWDFASYHPNYERALNIIGSSKWKVFRLGDLAKFFKYGASIPADYVQKGTVFIRAQNIREYGIDLSDECYIDSSIYSLERYTVEVGDILITRSGINVGDAAVITRKLAGSVHGSYSIRLRLSNPDVSPEFVTYAINSPLVRAQIMALKGRSAQPNINIAELSSLKIIVPPLETQTAIIALMQEAFDLQRVNYEYAKKILADSSQIVVRELDLNLDDFKDEKHFKVSIEKLRGGRFDLDLHNTKYTRLIEHLNQKYKGNLESLRSICEPITSGATPLGSNYVDEGIPFIRVQNVEEDGTLNLNDLLFVTPGFAKSIERAALQNGDLLLVIVGATIGKCAVVRGLSSFTVPNQAIARIRLKENIRFDIDFIQAFLNSAAGLIQINALKRPVAQGNLNLSEAGKIQIPVVSIEIQHSIVAKIKEARVAARKVKMEADNIVEQAKSRSEKLILGE